MMLHMVYTVHVIIERNARKTFANDCRASVNKYLISHSTKYVYETITNKMTLSTFEIFQQCKIWLQFFSVGYDVDRVLL